MLGAKVSISFVGGQHFEHFVAHPKGDPENPVSFEQLEFKFRGLAGEVVSDRERVAGVIEKIKYLDELIDISELVTLCNP
jgi:2-methylcitrate dehydratase PrpD